MILVAVAMLAVVKDTGLLLSTFVSEPFTDAWRFGDESTATALSRQEIHSISGSRSNIYFQGERPNCWVAYCVGGVYKTKFNI